MDKDGGGRARRLLVRSCDADIKVALQTSTERTSRSLFKDGQPTRRNSSRRHQLINSEESAIVSSLRRHFRLTASIRYSSGYVVFMPM